MVEKHCWVVLLKLLDEPPLLFDRQLVTECDMLSELFQALEGGLLSSLLELTCRHLLTEGERYTATTKQRQVLVCTLDPDSTVRKCHLRKHTCYAVRILALLQGSQGLRHRLDQRRRHLESVCQIKTEIRTGRL